MQTTSPSASTTDTAIQSHTQNWNSCFFAAPNNYDFATGASRQLSFWRTSQRRQILLVAIIFATVLVIVLFASASDMMKYSALQASGITTNGTVVSVRTVQSYDKHGSLIFTNFVTYEFASAGSPARNYTNEQRVIRDYSQGQTIQIQYASGNPDYSDIPTDDPDYGSFSMVVLIGLLCLLAILTCAGYLGYLYMGDRRLSRRGTLVPGKLTLSSGEVVKGDKGSSRYVVHLMFKFTVPGVTISDSTTFDYS